MCAGEGEQLTGLLEALDGDPTVDAAVSDAALVAAMVDVEAGLVRALSRAGLVSEETGRRVTDALARVTVDPADLGRRSLSSGNPVVPLVAGLVDAVPEPDGAAVHLGATSQDVLDSALMLAASRARVRVLEELHRAVAAASRLAAEHRRTLMVARTLGQPALPTTFGLKASGWSSGLVQASRRLADAEAAAQLGGAGGTLAAYGGKGLDVLSLLSAELGLVDPGAPWHTERSRVHAWAFALAEVVLAAGKVATDVLLMAQAEVGEVTEGAPGGSSAMPHKQNPVASVLLVAAARRAPVLVASVLSAGLHEHERATGSWHAEWVPLRDLVRLAGGSAARVADLLENLRVHPDVLRRNLDAAGPGVMSEAYAGERIATLGRAGAQEAARQAVSEAERTGTTLGEPSGYLGSADALVERALKAAQERP